MRKVILFTAMSLCLIAGYAQSSKQKTIAAESTTKEGDMYKKVKVDIGFGYAIPSSGGGAKAGITFTIEPHYRLTDNIAVGLRLEGAALGYEIKSSTGSSDIKVSLLNSYCATGEYYFGSGAFRPFGGVGLGVFTQSSLDNSTGTLIPSSSMFGFFPTLGFETGHFRMSGSYNSVGSGGGGYIGFKLGFFFGGGKK